MIVYNDSDIVNAFVLPPKRDLKTVTEIVIHHTAGNGTWKGIKSWILGKNNERINQHKRFIGLTHYYIDKDGRINQAFPLDTWLYHSCSGKHDKVTAGIELVHGSGEFTAEQYNSLAELITRIADTCPIKTIVSHDYNYLHYSGKTKGCPGKDFNWEKLQEMLPDKIQMIEVWRA